MNETSRAIAWTRLQSDVINNVDDTQQQQLRGKHQQQQYTDDSYDSSRRNNNRSSKQHHQPEHPFQQQLICVNLDKTSESEWSWVLTLILLWFLDAKKPSVATILCKNRYSNSDEDDVDAKREANYASARDIAINLLQFVSIVTVQVLVAIKFDTVIDRDYVLLFIPLYIFKAVNFERNFYSIHTVKSDLDCIIIRTPNNVKKGIITIKYDQNVVILIVKHHCQR